MLFNSYCINEKQDSGLLVSFTSKCAALIRCITIIRTVDFLRLHNYSCYIYSICFTVLLNQEERGLRFKKARMPGNKSGYKSYIVPLS